MKPHGQAHARSRTIRRPTLPGWRFLLHAAVSKQAACQLGGQFAKAQREPTFRTPKKNGAKGKLLDPPSR
jgi:hypothetical protein